MNNKMESLFIKLKAIITDPTASSGEQKNAIAILMRFKAKGENIGTIPEAVRPAKKRIFENVGKYISKTVKVIEVIRHKEYFMYRYRKTPMKRLKNTYPYIPLKAMSENDMPNNYVVETETYYKTTFYKHKLEYIFFEKVDIETHMTMETGEQFLIDSNLIQESNEPIGNPNIWHEDAFNDISNKEYAFTTEV